MKTIIVDGRNLTNVYVKTREGKQFRLYGPSGYNVDSNTANQSVFGFAGAIIHARDDYYYGIKIGSGTSPVSRDDYTIEDITSYFSYNTTTFTGLDDSGRPYVKQVILCTNTSSQTRTIAEVAFMPALYGILDGETSRSRKRVLIDRTLLSSPVTLAPNESCSIDYTIVNQFDI